MQTPKTLDKPEECPIIFIGSIEREDCVKRVYIFANVLVVFAYLRVSATIINIPDDYPTIQQGIDASTDGDTVLVQPGTYVENINFNGHNIVLGSLFLTTGDMTYILETVIDGNDASGPLMTFESGEDSTAVLSGFTIRNAESSYDGGGIRINGSSPAIYYNVIVENWVSGFDGDGCGGGIYCNNGNPIIENNIIARNSATAGGHGNPHSRGAGIYFKNSDGLIINNIVCGNTSYNGYGGALYIENVNTVISNNVFWANTSSYGFQISGDSAIISYCNVQNGYPGEGNIDNLPLFINAHQNDYNICSQSPCIDAGDPDIMDPDGTRSDIGIYFPEHPECFVGDKWHISPEGNDSTGDGTIQNPFRTIQHGIDICIPGDSVIVENGMYMENLIFYLKEIGVFSRYVYTNDSEDIYGTIIDGNAEASVATVQGCDTLTAISGFTITNGLAGDGGGLSVRDSRLRISNNYITENATTYNYGHGGGIYCVNSDCTIINNIICRNFAYSQGGGITCFGSNAVIMNNTISHNGRSSGGIESRGSDPLIINNIVWGNAMPQLDLDYPFPTVFYCDIQGGWQGEGNIDVVPLFVDPQSGDYNLCAQSLCIDAGDPQLYDPDGTRSDIGVFFPEHPQCLQGNIWYVSVTGDDETGDGSRNNPWRTIQHGIEMSIPGDTVIAENGIYEENIYMFSKAITLASNFIYSGDSLDIINTMIDGDSLAPAVTLEYCDDRTLLFGFTVSRGLPCGVYAYEAEARIGFNNIEGNFGSGISCSVSSPRIFGNIVSGNSSGLGGGISCYASRPLILNNFIVGNEAVYGGGIHCRNVSVPFIWNNVICRNIAEAGGGIYNSQSFYNIWVRNTIMRDNVPTQIMNVNYGEIYVEYSNIQGGWEGPGNIDVDPLFRDPDNGDFHLMSTACGDPYDSPCIDAGSPDIIDSLLDCSWGLGGLRSDMGAYGGGDSAMVGIDDYSDLIPKRFALIQNYPNPFNAITVIQYNLPLKSDVTIEIYDILGRKVETLIQGEQPAGQHQAIWKAEDQSSGIYFYRIQAGEYAETRKMVLLK